MKNYTFDVNKMIRWLMPAFIFRPIHYAWLQTLLAPLTTQYAAFLAYRAQQLKNATINSSVNRLTQALWDNFDPTNAIYLLQQTNYIDEPFIFLQSDGATPAYDYLLSDAHTPAEYDYMLSELTSNVNFIVRIPVALVADTAAIYAFVATYVFSGISFTIETF